MCNTMVMSCVLLGDDGASSMLNVRFKAERGWKQEEVDAMAPELVTVIANIRHAFLLHKWFVAAVEGCVPTCFITRGRGSYRTLEAFQDGIDFAPMLLVDDKVAYCV